MKYLIVLSIIIIIVGILIYRWYFKNKEGFLTQDDSLVTINHTTQYNYLWSNSLFLEQKSKADTESLIVFQKPKISDGTSKILGTMIIDNLEDIDKKSIIVSKDIKNPTELNEIFEFNEADTSIPIFNKLLSYDKLLEIQKNNNIVIDILNNSITEINYIFSQIYNSLSNIYNITLYRNSLGESGEDKKLVETDDGKLIYTIDNVNYNAFKFPIGSTVEIETRSGNNYKFKIPVENMFDSDGNVIDITDINSDKLYEGSGIDKNSFNPFGKNGLGWLNNGEINKTYYQNARYNFNFNYAISDSSSGSGYLDKADLFNYFNSTLIKEEKGNELKHSNSNNYIQIGNKIYFVKHIIEIQNNDTEYYINQIHSIYKNVYKAGEKKDYLSKSKCINKGPGERNNNPDYTFTNLDIGRINSRCEGSSQKVLTYRSLGCGIKQNRIYCINKNDYITANVNDTRYNYDIGKSYYINCEWIDNNEYENYKTINFDESDGLMECKIIYGAREDYNKTYKSSFNIHRNNSTSPSNSININNINSLTDSVQALFNIDINGLFYVKKRNILACLWKYGRVTFENYYTDDHGNRFEMDFLFHSSGYNHQGPRFSPYFTIKFSQPEDAKLYVANLINKLQREVVKGKFKNPTYETKSIDLSEYKITKSQKNNNIAQIYQNISDVLDNINNNELITSDEINNIKTELQNITQSLNTSIDLYYFNFMTTLNKYKIINKKIKSDDFFNLYDGKVVNIKDILKYKIKKLTVTIEKENRPIKHILANNIIKLNSKLNLFKEKFIKNSEKTTEIINSIETNTLKHYPFTIYRPTAPKGYKSLGDIIGISGYTDEKSSSLNNINPKNNINEYGCVPENCAIEVRQWLNSDKVYEYKNGEKYIALFRNPYTQTFKTVTNEGSTPAGKVEKLVSCVAKSNIISELKKADRCANEYKRSYEKVINQTSLDSSSTIFDTQESRMQSAIADRQSVINSLKSEINQIQIQDKRASIINHNINRKKFQDLLDRQIYNMDQLITNLYSIISINVNMAELIAKLKERGVTKEKIDEVISTIRAGKSLYPLLNDSTTIDDATTDSGEEGDSHIADPVKLQRIIYRTQDGNEQEMILRSLVESSCGCYFTDDEVIRTR
jgi:hypothetical protein